MVRGVTRKTVNNRRYVMKPFWEEISALKLRQMKYSRVFTMAETLVTKAEAQIVH